MTVRPVPLPSQSSVLVVPTGVATTDTAALVAAVSKVTNAGGGTVLIGPGTAYINQTLLPGSGVWFDGVGKGVRTTPSAAAKGSCIAAADGTSLEALIKYVDVEGVGIGENLVLDGRDLADTPLIIGSYQSKMAGECKRGKLYGMVITGRTGGAHECIFAPGAIISQNARGIGLLIDGVTNGATADNEICDGSIIRGAPIGVYLKKASGNAIRGHVYPWPSDEEGAGPGVVIEGGGTNIVACYLDEFRKNGEPIVLLKPYIAPVGGAVTPAFHNIIQGCRGLTIKDAGPDGYGPIVRCDDGGSSHGVYGVLINGNFWDSDEPTSGRFSAIVDTVQSNNGVHGVVVTNNMVNSAVAVYTGAEPLYHSGNLLSRDYYWASAAVDVDAPPVRKPKDNKFLAWTCDPELANQSFLPNAGGTFMGKLLVAGPTAITSVVMEVIVAGATLTANQNEVGIYKPDGTLVARTASQHTAWTSTGEKVMALTAESGQSLAIDVGYYAGVIVAGTTRPTFTRLATGNQTVDSVNAGLAQADGYRAVAGGATASRLAAPADMSGKGLNIPFIGVR